MRKLYFLLIIFFHLTGTMKAQNFSSGPIPMCDTSYFTCYVSGIGTLMPPLSGWGMSLNSIEIDITTNHPQTLAIYLISASSDTLLLSDFNGAGGQNYTNTSFEYSAYPSITTGTAPFNGNWTAEGGSLSIFDNTWADGTWTIMIIDTACASGGNGPGGPWTPGFFNGNAAGGFTFFPNIPPCPGWLNNYNVYTCPGETVDLMSYYQSTGMSIYFILNGNSIPSPYIVSGTNTYTVEGYDSWGCWYWATISINELPQISLGPDQVVSVCNGSSVNLQALFGQSGTSTWSLNGNPITIAAAQNASTPGVYQLIASNLADCNDTMLITLNNTGFNLGADITINTCSGFPIDLTTLYNTSGYTTSWSTGGTTVSNPNSVLTGGTFILVATDVSGCTDTAEVILNFNSSAILGADQTVTACSGSSVNLTTLYNTNGLTASWTYNGAAVTLPSSVTAPGIYMLVAYDNSGCMDTAEVNVISLAGPSLGTDQFISICNGSSTDLTNVFSTNGLITSWTYNGNAVPDPSNVNLTGTYELVATDASGCSDTANITITFTATPSLGADQILSVCSNLSVDLTSLYNTSGYTTNWTTNGNAVPNPSDINQPGSYQLIASAGSCSDTAVVNLSINNAPSLGSDVVYDVCSNETADISNVINTTGLNSVWSFNGNPIPLPTSVNQTGIYEVIATDANGCTDTASVVLNQVQAPSLGVDQNISVCANDDVNLNSLYNLSGYIAAWSDVNGIVTNPASVNTAGNYELIAVAANGCSDTATVNITVNPLPSIGADIQTIHCNGEIIDLTSLYVTGSNTVLWTENNVPVSNPAQIVNPGIYVITLTDNNGCTASANVDLEFNAKPDLGTDQVSELCTGSTLDLNSLFNVIGLSPQWSIMGIPVTNASAISDAGNYELIVTNTDGCKDTAYVQVNTHLPPDIGADQSHALCSWMNLDLEAIFNTYGYISDYSFNGNPVLNYNSVHDSGLYVITVTDVNGCTDEALAEITNVECLCVADFDFTAGCLQDPVSFRLKTDSAVVNAHWSFGNYHASVNETDPVIEFANEGVIPVKVDVQLSCGTVTIEKVVELKDCSDSCRFYFPSAFTPNNDVINDVFAGYGECQPEEFNIAIFDRFGKVIFKSRDPQLKWDGKFDNEFVPAGVYVYKLEYRLPYQQKKSEIHQLTLLR